ncbi:MAG: carbon-nitrogen hydrolase, partial [Lentisphaeraceae bacterium]|nr:carbon-nitrogen hydrolase [Lentisphaeraceae bacterium]
MSVKIAIIQGRDQGSKEKNLEYTTNKISEAATSGANIVCTQELFTGDYFCRTQSDEPFNSAEAIPGPSTDALQKAAKDNNIVVVGSLFEEAMTGLYYNTAVIIDADGTYLGKYRKNHIPQDPYFEEKFYFAPGDTGYPIWETKFGKIGVIICWDQWYPEAARSLALKGAEIILVPTAIGWLPDEKEELGEAQHHAWQQVQLGHAVANGCYYAAVNRVGIEAPIEFWGQSFIAN